MENSLFYTQFSVLNAGNRLLGFCNFKIFWGSMPPDTPWKRGLLIQSVTLFKSAGYFNFYWNSCFGDHYFSLAYWLFTDIVRIEVILVTFGTQAVKEGMERRCRLNQYNSTHFDFKKWQLHRLSKCQTLLTTRLHTTERSCYDMNSWFKPVNKFFCPDKKLTFSLKLNRLIWTPVNMDQPPKSQTLIMVNLGLWMQVFCALSVTDMIEYCTTGSPDSICRFVRI